MRRGLLLLLVALVSAAGFVGVATARAPEAQHAVYSDNWQGITYVAGLGTCPLLGTAPSPYYVFGDVDLTDHINSTYTPIANQPLYQIDSVGTVHGLINASDGTYKVAGGGFRENRTGDLALLYFSGTGHVTISGPGGTVVGEATFQDLLGFPPAEFDLLFTSITSCHLK